MATKKVTIKERAELVYSAVSTMYPEAYCELVHSNELELLIAIMLSAQTTDESVNKVTKTLFTQYRSLTDYQNASIKDLEHSLRHLGLFRNKAMNLKRMVERISTVFHGEIPCNQEDLESLPGVGRKTANVFLAVWHHIPRIAVDTHVERVAKRLGLAKESDSVLEVENSLMKKFPKSTWISLHHQILFFGRYFCKAKAPKCKECPIVDICLRPFL